MPSLVKIAIFAIAAVVNFDFASATLNPNPGFGPRLPKSQHSSNSGGGSGDIARKFVKDAQLRRRSPLPVQTGIRRPPGMRPHPAGAFPASSFPTSKMLAAEHKGEAGLYGKNEALHHFHMGEHHSNLAIHAQSRGDHHGLAFHGRMAAKFKANFVEMGGRMGRNGPTQP